MSSVPIHHAQSAAAAMPVVAGYARNGRTRFGLVVLFILAVFGALELATRWWLFPASKDFARFAHYPAQARRLSEANGLRIALVGNSATQRGISADGLATLLTTECEIPTAVEMFAADASKVNSWHYMANQYFWKTAQIPDVMVVNFYENNLIDGNRLEIGRLAQFFTDRHDWSEVFQYELTDNVDRCEMILSSFWATMAARDRIKQRLMKALVPHFEEYTQEVNAALLPNPGAAVKKQVVTHQTLQRFLERAKQHGTRVCFVAFPTINCLQNDAYELRPETSAVLREFGAMLIDLRQVSELTEKDYADKLHLNEEGRAIYTRRLANELSAFLTVERQRLLRKSSRFNALPSPE